MLRYLCKQRFWLKKALRLPSGCCAVPLTDNQSFEPSNSSGRCFRVFGGAGGGEGATSGAPGPEIQISGKAGTDKQTGAHEHFTVVQEIWGCEGSVRYEREHVCERLSVLLPFSAVLLIIVTATCENIVSKCQHTSTMRHHGRTKKKKGGSAIECFSKVFSLSLLHSVCTVSSFFARKFGSSSREISHVTLAVDSWVEPEGQARARIADVQGYFNRTSRWPDPCPLPLRIFSFLFFSSFFFLSTNCVSTSLPLAT